MSVQNQFLEFTITIPGLPSTQSGYFGNFFARRSHDKKWAKKVVQECLGELLWSGQGLPLLSHVELTCVRASFGTKEPDYDNLVSSFKPLIDALLPASKPSEHGTRIGLIRSDDNSVIVKRIYKWQTAPPGKGFVQITVRGRIIEELA